MPDTTDALAGITQETRTVRMRKPEVDARCAELQANTDAERIELLGMARATYYRSRRDGGCNLSLYIARNAAASIGWTVDQMFEAVR